MNLKYILPGLFLISSVFTIVPIKNKSINFRYLVQLTSYQAFDVLTKRFPWFRESCSGVTESGCTFCQLTKAYLVDILQESDYISYLDAVDEETAQTTIPTSNSGKRSVPWNQDRLNQMSNHLDGSYKDNADVDIYVLGTLIKVDHAEFGGRATVGFNQFDDSNSDSCDTSGTQIASLAAGKSLGVARNARVIGVTVLDCDRKTDIMRIIDGIKFVQESILKSPGRRAVALIGFSLQHVDVNIDDALISLTELDKGVLVVVGGGDVQKDLGHCSQSNSCKHPLDSCGVTPSSAQGETAMDGVVSVGAIDKEDTAISNIGECVDLFAPGRDVPAADNSDQVAVSTCTGSICAAALAAGVIANSLKDNSKIDIEVQKSMLVNGATINNNMKFPHYDIQHYNITKLIAHTPRRILYYTCGYYREESAPTCTSFNNYCNYPDIRTFDGISVPANYKQLDKNCNFTLFKSPENDVTIKASYHTCSLASYHITWGDVRMELHPAPHLFYYGDKEYSQHKEYYLNFTRSTEKAGDGKIVVEHKMETSKAFNEPLVTILLETGSGTLLEITYDGNSRVKITLNNFEVFSGKTSGLCGLYDGIGTNDYLLPDGSILERYSTAYHSKWQDDTCSESDELQYCVDVGEECEKEAKLYCENNFKEASATCLDGVEVYKETQNCIRDVSKCCCEVRSREGNVDLHKSCCQDSFFGNFERNRDGCSFCKEYRCEKDETHENCIIINDDAGQRTHFDYLEKVVYSPKNCCFYIKPPIESHNKSHNESHKEQICTAPRSPAMMWDKPMPQCLKKTCKLRKIPNEWTVVSPLKEEYECQDRINITCKSCHEIDPSPQIIECQAGDSKSENDADWNEDIRECQMIECPQPQLPSIDKKKGSDAALSWISSPIPYSTDCGSSVTYQCDLCYTMYGEDTSTCQETGRWSPVPRCRLKHCDLSIPHTSVSIVKPVKQACNDTIEYECTTNGEEDVEVACFEMEGSPTRTCRVDDDGSADWDTEEPRCNRKHCHALESIDLEGKGNYEYRSNENDVYEKITLSETAIGYTGPTECGSEVHVVCDECSYLCGSEYRQCLSSKEWSGDRPLCQERLCSPPDVKPDTHATFTPSYRSYKCGESVKYTCDSACYEHASGDEVHECRPVITEPFNPKFSKAQWEGTPFVCELKQCPTLDPPENGAIVEGDQDTSCGKTIQFKCNDCYDLDGADSTTCQNDKTWSNSVPKCVFKTCPDLIKPLNGHVEVKSNTCNSEATYSCDECYYLDPATAETTKCLSSRSWSIPTPSCEQYICPSRTSPKNGAIINANNYFCGESVQYECNECYKLSGSVTSTCLAGGVWSSAAPSCTIITCPRPHVPANTQISTDRDTYNCGDYIEVRCAECYELPHVVIYCTEDGTWSPESVPKCDLSKCNAPDKLQVRNATEDYGLTYDSEEMDALFEAEGVVDTSCGSKVPYKCHECYNLIGDPIIECQDNKTWSELPYCDLKTCSKPVYNYTHLVYSEVRELYSCGESINFSCDDECWFLDGPDSIRCIPDTATNISIWQPSDLPQCTITDCMPPPLDEDSLVTYTEGSTCGTTVTFSCPECYELVGHNNATCRPDGQWDNTVPVCKPVCCPPIPEVRSEDDSYDVAIQTYSYTVASDDDQQQECDRDHVCQQVAVTCDTCYEYHDANGTIFENPPSRSCRKDGSGNGYWSNKDESCQRKTCPVRALEKKNHAHYLDPNMEQKVLCKDSVKFECDICHENLDYELSQECLPSKQWSHPLPICSLKRCPELPVVNNCRFNNGSNTCGYKRKMECSDCHYVDKCWEGNKDLTTLQCHDNKKWEWISGTPVVKVKTCDEPPSDPNASVRSNSADTTVYECGRIMKYECNECYKLEDDPEECNCATIRCEGTHETDCTKGTWKGNFPKCVPITCPPLEAPDNGRLDSQKSGCGQETMMSCNEGYELVYGDLVRECTTTGKWTGADPQCQIRNCTALEAPLHGYISTTDRHYGTVVTFSCADCYRIPDFMKDPSVLESHTTYPRYHILKCESSGNWNGSAPLCRQKYCQNPGIPANANTTDDSDEVFACGNKVGYRCNEGYYQTGGSKELTCTSSSTWDEEPIECEVKYCKIPTAAKNGQYSPVHDRDEDYVYKTQVTYSCNYCFVSSDTTFDIECDDRYKNDDQTKFAVWSGSPPTCNRITCPPLSDPAHGHLKLIRENIDSTACSQIVELVCDEGYQPVQDMVYSKCLSNGQWTTPNLACEKICCTDRGSPRHGGVIKTGSSGSSNLCYQDTVTYTCNSCYKLVEGAATQTCQASGAWSDYKPWCKQIFCPYPRSPKHGGFTFNSGNALSGSCGTSVVFSCDEGYEIEGFYEIKCTETGEWSKEFPTCKSKKQCPGSSLDITNGRAIVDAMQPTFSPLSTTAPNSGLSTMSELDDFYSIHTFVHFECDDEYKLIGPQDASCSSNGTWIPGIPRCSKVKCAVPTDPDNGRAEANSLYEGGISKYTCNRCYRLSGYNSMECWNGKWIPDDPPVCIENTCSPPGMEPFSSIVDYNPSKLSYSCGEEIDYECDEGYVLHGSRTRVCSDMGIWSSKAPVCADVTCDMVGNITNGDMKYDKHTKMLYFSCDKGYRLHGDAEVRCIKGQWMGVIASCAIEVCGDPGVPTFGKRSGSSFKYGDMVTFGCDAGYDLRGRRFLTCRHDGTWDYSTPECVCNECPRLPVFPNGFIETTGMNSYLSVVEYICNYGYELVGSAVRTCQASGEWSGDPPTCVRVNCTEEVGVPTGAEIVRRDGHSYKDTVMIECTNGAGSWTRRCQRNGQWSGSLPNSCDCKLEIRQEKRTKKVLVPSVCLGGICFPSKERWETHYEEIQVEICN